MAGSQQARALRDVASCSICLEYFSDPVSLDCGHSFCRPCITRCWEGAGPDPLCPQCRSQGRTLRPNRELGAIVEFMKLNIPPTEGAPGEGLCPRHLQRLQLFCAEDHTLLCVVCRESRVHKPHTVSPIEEAAQGFRDTLQRHMEQLSTELQGLEQQRTQGLRTASDLEENLKDRTKRTHRTFKNLEEYLEREKQRLLRRLEQEHQENLKNIQGALTRLEGQLTTHRDLVAAIEGKCEQPDAELLGDVQDILSRCESVRDQNPKGESEKHHNTQSPREQDPLHEKIMEIKEGFPAELSPGQQEPLHEKIMEIKEGSPAGLSPRQQDPLHEKIMEIKEGFPAELEWSYVKGFEREVTLDPDTAHHRLILSEDGRSVGEGGKDQDLLDVPERFDTNVIVLGRQRLSSGGHYWEVDVGDATDWYLGVCDESASRKGDLTFETADGYWLMVLIADEYMAYTPRVTPLTPRVPLRVVGLFLDCEEGRLSFYNVQDRSLLFTFSGVSSPRTLRPLFSPEFSEDGKLTAELRICPVTVLE